MLWAGLEPGIPAQEAGALTKATAPSVFKTPLFEARGARFTHSPYWHTSVTHACVFTRILAKTGIFIVKVQKGAKEICALIIRVSIQSCEFNLCAKLEYRIKTFASEHRFHPTSQREQNRHFLVNWHYIKLGEATEYNNFHIWKWLAPQSEQTKRNKGCHCFRRCCWNIIQKYFDNTFQNDQNNISDTVERDRSAASQVILSHSAKSQDFFDALGRIYSQNAFPSPMIRMNPFSKTTKCGISITRFSYDTLKCALKQGDGNPAIDSKTLCILRYTQYIVMSTGVSVVLIFQDWPVTPLPPLSVFCADGESSGPLLWTHSLYWERHTAAGSQQTSVYLGSLEQHDVDSELNTSRRSSRGCLLKWQTLD